MASQIKARCLIISNTRGLQLANPPQADLDVVIHCGDLTEHSILAEFRETIHLLRGIRAPLKLVIAGNHDFSLDDAAFTRKIEEARRMSDENIDASLESDYGAKGAARRLWDEVANEGIILLDEGTHHFTLQNGALLKVYASPYTPSADEWGFQYAGAHDFNIEDDVDIAITHGPPRGIMDMTAEKKRIGCPMLFRAIARARPRIHCFGHVHNGWGARLATWRLSTIENLTYFNAIDHKNSYMVDNLLTLAGSQLENAEEREEREIRIARLRRQAYRNYGHPISKGSTLLSMRH